MFSLKRFNITIRLTLSFTVLILLMLLGGIVGFLQLNIIRNQVENLQQVDLKATTTLQIHNDLLDIRYQIQQSVQHQNISSFVDKQLTLQNKFLSNVETVINMLSTTPLENFDNQQAIKALETLKVTVPTQIDTVLNLAQNEDWETVNLFLETDIVKTSKATQDLAWQINIALSEEHTQTQENIRHAQEQANLAITITGLLTLLVAIILAISVTQSIVQPLARLNEGAKALAEGNFSHHIKWNGNDELAHLSQVFNTASSQLASLYADLEAGVEQHTKKLHYRAQQLATSATLAQKITSILDLETLLEQVVHLIEKGYGYQAVAILLLNQDNNELIIQACAGEVCTPPNNKVGEVIVPLANSLIATVIKTQKPAYTNNIATQTDCKTLNIDPNSQAKLILPLQMGKNLLGLLCIESNLVDTFADGDIPALRSLSDQITIAIYNASLYQKEKSRRQLVETMDQIGKALTHTLNLQKVLDLILEKLAQIVSYDRAAVLLRQGDELEVLAARGFPPESQAIQLNIPLKENDVFQKIHRTQTPLIIADVVERHDWQNVESLPQARAWLGVPLTHLGEVIGILSLARESPNAYQPEDADLALSFAGQAAIALENARLYDQIMRFSHDLEEKVRERTRELEVAYQQLERLDRTKSDFITVASHELRTPLTILHGYSQLLLREAVIQENEYYKEMITGINFGADRLHEVIDTMLDMAQIDSSSLDLYLKPHKIQPTIAKIHKEFAESLTERKLTLTITNIKELPSLESDEKALQKIFHHLISNAIKYTPDGGTISINGQTLLDKANNKPVGIKITISDTGIGIDPQSQELIFTKFYQTGETASHSTGKTKFKGGGPGLGLTIARGMVEAHNGKLWVESPGYDEEATPGSDFHVAFPIRQDIPLNVFEEAIDNNE